MNAIEVRNLTYRYPDGTAALQGVSFSVTPGECLALIGPNGAGKSTLLLHLNGLLPERFASPPAVTVMDLPVIPPNLPAIRRQVGLLFQDANDQLFCPTVFDDVAFGPQQLGLDDAQVRDRVARALAQVGLTGLENRPPHHLSAGQKRRACLAGVLACDPAVLVLDEPTSGLDPRGRCELIQLLRQIPVAKIIATHDLELVVQLCSRALLLSAGQLVAQGPPHDLLADEPLMLRHGLETPHILRHRHPHD